MKSLAILSQHFYPSYASTAQLLTDLALGLSQSGYNVQIFTTTPSDNNDPLPQISIIRTPFPLQESQSIIDKGIASLLFLINGLTYILRLSKQTPLLIASNPPYAGVLGIFFKIFKDGQYIFLFQDIFPESAVLSGIIQPHSLACKIFESLLNAICQHSQQTIVLTATIQSYLEKKYPAIQNKLTVIENWSIEAIEPISKQNNPFAQAHNLHETFTVLYSGNIGRLHDIETIAQAIYRLKESPIKFVFIGDGPKQKILSNYQTKYQLKNLLLLPFQPREQLTYTLTACDVSLVSLIGGAENIVAPCKLYGMLASGRAIVAVSQPNSYIDQLLTTHQCGLNCPPQSPEQLVETILTLFNSPDRVAKMGKKAHQLYRQNYTRERAIKQYQQLFSDTLNLPELYS